MRGRPRGFGLRRILALASTAGLILLAQAALAQYRHRVVLLEPTGDVKNPEIHARLRGELASAGFDVVTRPVAAGVDLKANAESIAGELHPAAVLYVVEPGLDADETTPSEVWISDRLLRRTFVMRFRTDPGVPANETARVAVQAVEILKADLAELSVTREEHPEPHPEPAKPPPPPVVTVRPSRPAHLELHAGAGLLKGVTGAAPTWTPLARVGASVPESWVGGAPLSISLLASLAAFGGEVRVEADEGEARVRQGFGGLDVALRLAPGAVLQPVFMVSGGVYTATVEGAGSAQVHTRQTWSGVAGGGLGAWFELGPSFALLMSGELSVAWARTVVRVAERRVAAAGAPLALGSLSAVGVF